MKKKIISLAIVTLVVLSASAMVLKLTYQKVSDTDCNKCVISNSDEGSTRKCGKCEKGFLNGGKGESIDDGWTKATFTCNNCGHQSVWKYKMK